MEIIPASGSVLVGHQQLGLFDKLGSTTAKLFHRFGINVGPAMRLGPDTVVVQSEDDEVLCAVHPLSQENITETAANILAVIDSVLDRYQRARTNNVIVDQKTEDTSVLSFNVAVWNLLGAKGHVDLLPDAARHRAFMPRDPDLLRIVRADDVQTVVMKQCLIKGTRVLGAFSFDMFPDLDQEVSAAITLEGDIPEVRCQVSIRELQTFFVGYTFLSARASGRKGEIPRIEGKMKIERK